MSEQKDIRWIQRFDNYKKALKQLNEAINTMNDRKLTNLEKQGLVQVFEFTHELSWKVLKDFLEHRGATDLFGSRDVVRRAFNLNVIQHGDIWMNMIKSRNMTSHTYNEDTVDEIIEVIQSEYTEQFNQLKVVLSEIVEKEEK